MVGREAVPQQSKIRTTSCGEPEVGGAGWAFNPGQVSGGQKGLGVDAFWEKQGWKAVFGLQRILLKERGVAGTGGRG